MSDPTSISKPAKMELIEIKHGNRPYQEIENELLLQGKTDQEVADAFRVSVNTVKGYRKLLGYRTGRTIVPLDSKR